MVIPSSSNLTPHPAFPKQSTSPASLPLPASAQLAPWPSDGRFINCSLLSTSTTLLLSTDWRTKTHYSRNRTSSHLLPPSGRGMAWWKYEPFSTPPVHLTAQLGSCVSNHSAMPPTVGCGRDGDGCFVQPLSLVSDPAWIRWLNPLRRPQKSYNCCSRLVSSKWIKSSRLVNWAQRPRVEGKCKNER